VKFSERGVKGISIWRDAVEGLSPARVKEILKANQLSPVSYVRGGFFPSTDPVQRKAALEDNLSMIEEAASLEIPLLVLVCGAEPKQALQTSRDQIREGIEFLLPMARELGVKLAIEPLHPMYADTDRPLYHWARPTTWLSFLMMSSWVLR